MKKLFLGAVALALVGASADVSAPASAGPIVKPPKIYSICFAPKRQKGFFYTPEQVFGNGCWRPISESDVCQKYYKDHTSRSDMQFGGVGPMKIVACPEVH